MTKGLLGKSGSFRRNSLIMSSGAMLNIAIAVVLTPIVSRIYTKEEFGVFYLFASIVTISSLVSTGMYPHAIVLPKESQDFQKLLKLCFTLMGIGALLSIVIIFFGQNIIVELLNQPKLKHYLWLVPVGIITMSTNTILQNWNVRIKDFKKNASSMVGGSLSDRGGQLLAAQFSPPSFSNLIVVRLLSDVVKSAILFSKKMIVDLRSLKSVPFSSLKSSAITYQKYPKFVLTGTFVSQFTLDLPMFILAAYYGPEYVGAFGFAMAMLNIPYNVIGSSVAPVYFQRANELYNQDNQLLTKFTKNSYEKLLLLGALAFGFLFAFGDYLFWFVFSEEWILAGKMTQILSVYFIFRVISGPFSNIFRVVQKEELGLYVNILLAILRIVGIYLGVILLDDVMLVLALFTLANLIGYFAFNIAIFRLTNIPLVSVLSKTIALITLIFGGLYSVRLFLEYLFL